MSTESRAVRALIVEDEPVARRTLRRLLVEDEEVEVVGETAGRETVRRIRELEPDLILLDVQMPELNGFEVLDALESEHSPLVIFVTAFDEYAVKAFELRALDYLLKPFSDERFRNALELAKGIVLRGEVDRVRRRLAAFLATRGGVAPAGEIDRRDATPSAEYRDRIAIKSDGRITLVRVEDIDWLEATGSYVRVYSGGTSHLVRGALRELAASLDPRLFFRIHRSAVINLDRIAALQHWSHGDYLVVLKDGTELRLTRSRRQALEAIVGSAL
ncbi:MAG: LytR/AlgR family response regulator transcription factor [Longimicrobiales bacterium]